MKLLEKLQSFKAVMGLLVILTFIVINVNTADAKSKPRAPKLTLTGDVFEYDETLYPDGRIWLPPNEGEPREFLLPVFIQHQQWYTFYYENPTLVKYVVKPIESFQFSLLYNETAIRAVDVVTEIPPELEEQFFDDPLAENFHFSVDDAEDNHYWNYLNPDHPSIDKENGRQFKIVGTSNMPITVDNPRSETPELLLFVKFKVMYNNEPGQGNQFNKTSPIYIDNRVIKYNEVNFITEPVWKNMYEYDLSQYQIDYANPPGTSGTLGGLTNDKPSMQNLFQKEPYKEGVIWLNFSDQAPEFQIRSDEDEIIKVNDALYEFSKPITVDQNSTNPEFGSRIIQLLNKTSLSRLNFINVESNADWLEFKTVEIGDESKQPPQIREFTTKGLINYIDNGIIGVNPDPVGELADKADGDVFIQIKCDPTKLDVDDVDEETGLYVGYITFKSTYAGISPVRLKINFIHFASPFEPVEDKPAGVLGGIFLDMFNGNQAQRLVFGTGKRATDGVDPLYGEIAYDYEMSTTNFDARFFPYQDEDLSDQVPYGFGDRAADEANRRSNSRDIRSYFDTLQSITYYVRFNRVDPNLPVIIEWNVLRFPVGAQLFIRDTLNGNLFGAVNMREATVIDQYNRSFTIVDPRIKSFIIEYTLPRVINYVNKDGTPIIRKGWNLLSLPVRPTNNEWNIFYPNAINVPWMYNQNNYQPQEQLRPGVGYFVKYGDFIDVKFAGSYINEISEDNLPRDAVRVYPGDKEDPGTDEFGGWNAIGGLSVPVGTEGITFTEFQGEKPDVAYTMNYGVWRYDTDNGYKRVSQLMPGLGYWIKTNDNGYLKVVNSPLNKQNIDAYSNDDVLNRSVEINISDAVSSTELFISPDKNIDASGFELPPLPPVGMFDARFAGNTYVSNSDEPVIKLQGVDMPMNLTVRNADTDYEIRDAVTNRLLGNINKGETQSVVIDELPFGAIKLAKTNVIEDNDAFSLYPNPVVNSSTVNFNIVNDGMVKVQLFDELGNSVQTVVNEYRNAGDYSETLDASNLVSGTYILKITANGYSEVIKVNVVK